VNEERRHRASSARRSGERSWRACSAAMVGAVLLAVGSGGCATILGEHQVASRTSLGSGSAEGATGSGGKLTSPAAKGSGRSKAQSGAGGGLAGVANGAMFGGDLPLASIAGQLGRKLAIVRVYDQLGEQFQNRQVDSLMANGTTVLVSIDTVPGQASYASIAAGQHDQYFKGFLASVEQAAVRYSLPAIYVAFEHEADAAGHHQGLGTPAQFVQAWEHIHQLATSAHLDWNQGGRIHWVMIMTGAGYTKGVVGPFWPGTGEADAVGVDAYNTGGCRIARKRHQRFTGALRPPVTPASLFSAALQFAADHGGLPVFVAEWGSVTYNTATVRVNFMHQMQAFVQANSAIAAALYWDSQVPPCNYIIDNSAPSVAALAGMAQAPFMQGKPA